MAICFALFEPDRGDGGFVVTFPEVEGCVTQGETDEAAMEMATDTLCTMLGHLIDHGEEIPPARLHRGRHFRPVALPPVQSAKLELHRVFRASGMKKVELARRMGVQKTSVDRPFDLSHPSRIEQLETAFRALGKRLVIHIEDAA